MVANPVVHFEIYVENMQRAKAFYEAVLGITLENMQSPVPEMGLEMWFFPMDKDHAMQQYGSGGALVKTSAYTPAGQGGTVVYFSCDDCAEQIARSIQYGGSVFQDKMAIGEHGFCALAKDTEGNVIGFHSMK